LKTSKTFRLNISIFAISFLAFFSFYNHNSVVGHSRAPSSVDDDDSPFDNGAVPVTVESVAPASSSLSLPPSLPPTDLTAIMDLPEADVATKSWLALFYVSNDTRYHADLVNFNLSATSVEASAKIRKLATSEFQLYPPECLRKISLRKLVFTDNISITSPDGYTDTRSATLDPVNGIMIYSEALFNNFGSSDFESHRFLVSIIHHEFYHYLDIKQDGTATPDPGWSALNTPGFSYGNGGRYAQTASASVWTTAYPGFVNDYSRAGADEDKAEIWAGLFARGERLNSMMANDPILRNKVALIKQRAQNLCPSMNEAFWSRVSQTTQKRVQFATDISKAGGNLSSLKIPSF
jgi:hypothetical protein